MNAKVFDPLEYLQVIDPSTIIRPSKLQLVSDFSRFINSSIADKFSAWLIEQEYTVTEMQESMQGPGKFYTKPNDIRSVFIGVALDSRTFISITH